MNVRPVVTLLVILAALSGSGQSDPLLDPTARDRANEEGKNPKLPTPADLGLTAPFVSVDRFSDAAGTLLRRSADPALPKPNEPFSLDDPRFTIPVVGPAGSTARCYDLDVRPARPNRYYVFYDSLNNYRIGQFPVIDSVPGDPGYSDLWDIWKVVTPDAFHETNWVRDAATVERLLADPSSGYAGASTGIYLNAPVVPEGTTADHKGEGRAGRATLLYAWYRGRRAPFLYLEGSFHLGTDGTVPVGKLISGDGGAWPPKSPLASMSWPKHPGYSPLARIEDASGRPIVPGSINCPLVGTSAP